MKLEAKNLMFRYQNGDRELLNHFCLELESTERVGLMAPSGFGKTSLCKILAAYEKADSGQVLLDGKELSSWKGYCPVQMIWQHPEQAVNPKMRMRQVLLEGNAVERRVIEGLGIEEEWLSRFPAELSGGELQRFCIARALGKGTKFLLADEITAMLDLITQSQIWTFLLKEVKRREIGLLVVSHSEELLEQLCDRIINWEKMTFQKFENML